jgi:hypothetical protein
LRIARLQPQPRTFGQHLDQRRHIAQADVEALPGDRMHPVRRIAHQRQAMIDDPAVWWKLSG